MKFKNHDLRTGREINADNALRNTLPEIITLTIAAIAAIVYFILKRF